MDEETSVLAYTVSDVGGGEVVREDKAKIVPAVVVDHDVVEN